MLIVTRNSAIRRIKQKPRRWGPDSVLRSAVYENAKELGIDPASIAGVWPSWSGTGGLLLDPVGDLDGSIYGAQWRDEYIYFDGTNDYVSIPAPGISGTQSRALFVYLEVASVDTASENRVASLGVTNSGTLWRCDINMDSAVGTVRAPRISFGNGNITGTTDITDGTPHMVAYQATGGGTINDTEFFVNGAKETISGSTNPGNAINTTDSTAFFAVDDAATYYSNIALYTAVLFRTSQPDGVWEHLSEDPYALICPISRPVIVDWGAGGTALSLSGTVSASAMLMGSAGMRAALAGAAEAVSAASGDLAISARLSGTLGARATLSASARLDEALAGAVTAVAVLAGEAAEAAGLSGTVTAQAGGSAKARAAMALSGAIEALAMLTGDLTAGNILQLSGTISAVSSLSAEAAMRATLAGDVQAYAELLDAAARAEMRLSGAVEALSAARADSRLTETMAGLCAAVSGLTGSLLVVGEGLGILTDPIVVDVTRRWHLVSVSPRRGLLPVSRRMKLHRA